MAEVDIGISVVVPLYNEQDSIAELLRRLDDVLEFSELGKFIDAPLKSYSNGMIMRLGFSVAVQVDPDVLLVDEVIAVGDEAFQEKCFH